MAVFTLSADTSISGLAGKNGADFINTNGFTLTIDQDSRNGTNQSPSTILGGILINPTKGGKVIIDGRKVRLIPYVNGGGTIPAWDTVIRKGDASALLIGVYPNNGFNDASSLITGTALPSTGYLKVRQWNDVSFGVGPLTGIDASASAIQRVGWLDICATDSSAITCNRLGEFRVYGDWYVCGSTNGSANQTIPIPNNGQLKYVPGVWIEKTAGAKDYEFYGNAGTTTTTGTEAGRGKVVWCSSAGLIRIGNSGGATNGYVPPAGLEVVVPNVFLNCSSSGTKTLDIIPNATVGNRFNFITTGGGVINIDKASCNWYLGCTQPYSVQLSNSGFMDAISIAEAASPMNWTNVGVGNKPTTALLVSPLTLSLCYSGGTFTDCVWNRVSQAVSGAHILTLSDIANFTFANNTVRSNTIRGNATTYSVIGTRVSNCNWTTPTVIGSQMYFVQSSNINITDTKFVSGVSGTTVSTYVGYVWDINTVSSNFNISGLTFPVVDTHPYTALVSLSGAGSAVAGVSNVKVRNIGTFDTPLRLGTTVAGTGLIVALGAGGSVSDAKFQRVYCVSTRTGISTGDNSNTRITFENVFGDYLDAADVGSILNLTQKGIGGTLARTAQTGVYGTHWYDCFLSPSTGRIGIAMNESTTLTSSQIALSGGAGFTSTGALYFPAIDSSATFEIPYYVLGHSAFQLRDPSVNGDDLRKYDIKFAIDKNDGSSYGDWTTCGSVNLRALSGWETSIGFKLKLNVRCISTNTATITSIALITDSSTSIQRYQYPLDTINLSITVKDENNAPIAGAFAFIDDASSTYPFIMNTSTNTSGIATTAYTGGALLNSKWRVRKYGYKPYSQSVDIGTTDINLPVTLIVDPQQT